MNRWPLTLAAAWAVLLAHLLVAAAAEPIRPGKPFRAAGVVVATPPGFSLLTNMGVEITLIAGPADARTLARSVGAEVRVEGLRYEHTFRPYLLVESIKELE